MFGGLFGCSSDKPIDEKKLKAKILKQAAKKDWISDFKLVEEYLKSYILLDIPKNNKSINKGQSKLGGQPDLPKNIEWPNFNDKPMIFLGQINFAEFKELDIEDILPDTGLVYYFIHFKEPENEFGAEYNFLIDKKEYEVIYSTETALETRDFPENLPDAYKFNEQGISFKLGYCLPARESLEIEKFDPKDEDVIWDFNDEYGNVEGEQILGYCMPIQADVTWDWAFSYLNFPTYELTDTDNKNIDEIRPDFINLLQFSLDNSQTGFNKIGISIGYFGIKKEDLKNKRFDKTILIFQDT
jgi:uncharacterized protein YwqG